LGQFAAMGTATAPFAEPRTCPSRCGGMIATDFHLNPMPALHWLIVVVPVPLMSTCGDGIHIAHCCIGASLIKNNFGLGVDCLLQWHNAGHYYKMKNNLPDKYGPAKQH